MDMMIEENEMDSRLRGNDKAGFVLGIALMTMLCMCGTNGAVLAAEGADAAGTAKVELPTRMKEITGVVNARTRWNLSVETSRGTTSSKEMLIPFDKNTRLRGYRHYDLIARGDTISVVCKQTYETQKDGTERIMGTIAAQISLVKSRNNGKLTSKEK